MPFNDDYDDSQINQNKTNNTTTDTAAADTTCNNELLLHQSKSQEQQKQQHPQQRQQQQERDQPEQSQEVNPAVAAIEATEELIRKMDNAFAEFDDEDFFEDDDDDFAEKDDIDNSRNSNSNSNSNNEEYNNDNGDACDDLMNDNGISCCDDHNDNVNVEIDQDQKDDYVNNKKNNDLPKDAIDSLALNSDTFETCCNGGDENEMEHAVYSITDMDVNATKNGDANVTQCQQQQQFDVRKENASQLDEQNNQIVDEQSVASSSPSSLLSLSSHYSDIQEETDEENKQPQDQLHLIINTDTNDKNEIDNNQMNIQNDYDPDDKTQAKNTTIVNGISSTISHENHNTNGLCKNNHQEQQLISQEHNQAFEEEHDDDDDENMIQQVDKLEQVMNQEENDMNENNVIPESTNQTTDDDIQHDDGITDDMSSLSQYIFHEQEQCHLQLHPIQEQSFSSSKSFTETISSEIDTPGTINTHATTETMSNNDNMNDNQHTVLSSTNSNHNNNENNTSNCSSTSLSPPLKSCAKTLTYMYVEQSKSDQLAQSHAEDVLSLTLQIQNLQEQLQSEKESHVQTKEQFDTSNQNSIQLQKQFKHEMETVKEYHEHEIQKWNSNYESCMHSRSLAEEDAQQALDLAKESDNKRVEMEGLLNNALDEIEQLRSSFDTGSITAASPLGGGSVTSPYYNHTTPYGRDRAVVSMGRNLLRQVAEADDISSAFISRTDDGSTTSRMSNNSYLITLTRKSAEKRHRLRSQLQNSRNTTTSTGNEESSSSIVSVSGKEVLCFSSPNSQNGGLDLGYGSAFISTVKKVAKILKHSGKKLNLGGRWFYNTSSAISLKRQKGSSNSLDEFDLESMARSYCTSVEALISKQKKEVKELQQFCEYLEKKLDS